MAFKTFWFWKPRQLNERWSEVHAFKTAEFPHPSTVTTPGKPTEADPIWFGSLDNDGNLFMNWRDVDVVGIAPEMWFVVQETETPYPGGPQIPFVFVHGMVGDDFAPGTVVLGKKIVENKLPVTAVGVGNSIRVGYVQWYRETSKIQQVMVDENWRRKRIAVALFGLADLVIVSGNYGPYLNGGDVTTSDGEKLREAWSGSKRVIPRNGSVGGAGGI